MQAGADNVTDPGMVQSVESNSPNGRKDTTMLKEKINEAVNKLLSRTPEGRAAIAAQKKEVMRKLLHEKAVKEFSDFNQRAESELRSAEEIKVNADRHLSDLSEKYLRAKELYMGALADLQAITDRLNSERTELRKVILDNAEPILVDFIGEMDQLRTETIERSESIIPIRQRLEAIERAIKGAEALAFSIEEHSSEEIERELAGLRDAIPAPPKSDSPGVQTGALQIF